MRFIIIHKTTAHWESGGKPGPQLIARVGAFLGKLSSEKVLLSGEGLRASALGVRLRFVGGQCTRIPGPFEGEHECPAGFTLVKMETIEQAVQWATQQAKVLGDMEVDIRPVTEPWDIGMSAKPAVDAGLRFMVLRKSTPATELGPSLTKEQTTGLKRAVNALPQGAHLATYSLGPSKRGRRFKNTQDGMQVLDGPFVESKELIAGYILVDVADLETASRLAKEYLEVVSAHEVDVRDVEDDL